MNISYQGIGQVVATFAGSDLTVGHAVKLSANDTVSVCSAGDPLFGVVIGGRNGNFAIQCRGFVSLPYSGTAPTVGMASLSANGNGGIQVDADGRSFAVVSVDTAAKTATVLL